MKKLKKLFAVAAASALSTSAFAEGESAMTQYFNAIDITAVAATITAFGVLVIGVAMSEKGITVGKRNVRKI